MKREKMIIEMAEARTAMLYAWTEDEAFDEYCKCCDLRQELFPGKCGMTDCRKCKLTKDYNDVVREIRRRPASKVTINLFGCDVTMNVK